MSVIYTAIAWNRQKKIYDGTIAGLAGLYLAFFIGVGAWQHPNATIETLLIRGLGTLALLMLHVILAIGPLCRLSPHFLPLLYNRRHLGVSMTLVASFHGVFSLVQFHSGGDADPLVSLLASNTRFGSVANFPFQILGAAALVVLLLMAATSHDFWLHALSPGMWKRLHMCVYLAYFLLLAHVLLGVLQDETSPVLAGVLVSGSMAIAGLHLAAGIAEVRKDAARAQLAAGGFLDAGDLATIPDGRARVISAGGERIAVFRQGNEVSALSNVCRHQNGPLGEGKIVGGCVTCPWHGYQYDPRTGMSPPPYHDRVPVFPVKVVAGRVWVHPVACSKELIPS